MAGIDTSSYAPPPNPANPVSTLAGVAQIQNLRNQNRLFQQQYNTNMGLGRIYKEAINPETGMLDTGKVNALISQDPNVTLALPEAIQNSQQAQQRNIQINSAQLQNAQQHLETLTKYLTPILSNPKATSADVANALAHAQTTGIASPQQVIQTWASLPRDQNGQIDEGQIHDWAQANLMRVMSAQEQLNAISPAPTAINTGGQTQLVRTPQVGQPSLAGSLPNTLPPTTQVFNPQTNQMEFLGSQGAGGQPPAGPSSPNGGPAAAAGGGLLAAAPPLGAPEAAAVTAHQSAQQGVDLQRMADQVPQSKALLGNLEGDLKQFTSGPGTDWKRVAASFVNANNPFGAIFDLSKIASQDEFNKQALQLAQSQFQALGGTGTDAKLDSTLHTSPNIALSKMGNQGIINMLKGNQDAIAAKNQAWQKWLQEGHGPQTYGEFSTQFNKQYDPRVFQSVYNTPEDNKKMLAGMNKGEKQAFLNSYRTAITNGWVKLPDGQ